MPGHLQLPWTVLQTLTLSKRTSDSIGNLLNIEESDPESAPWRLRALRHHRGR